MVKCVLFLWNCFSRCDSGVCLVMIFSGCISLLRLKVFGRLFRVDSVSSRFLMCSRLMNLFLWLF